jgi:hypothetical protein
MPGLAGVAVNPQMGGVVSMPQLGQGFSRWSLTMG